MAEQPSSLERARAIKPKVKRLFEDIGTVNGVGLTRKDGAYAVKVNLETPLARGVTYPRRVDGVRIVIKVPGRIKKQTSQHNKKPTVTGGRAAKAG